LAAVLAGTLFPGDPLDMVGAPYVWPGGDARTPLGTDLMGRDLLAGLVHGARVSLLVGVGSALAALVLGIAVGAASGFYRGRVDAVLGR
ncbi:ABC transporter permease, partial [Escherichia coli]